MGCEMVAAIFLDIDGVICCNLAGRLEESKLLALHEIVKATSAKVSGMWVDNQLKEGTFTDKWDNSYTGAFTATAEPADSATAPVTWTAGGAFSLCSGATAAA